MQVGGDIEQPLVDQGDLALHLMFRLHYNRACVAGI